MSEFEQALDALGNTLSLLPDHWCDAVVVRIAITAWYNSQSVVSVVAETVAIAVDVLICCCSATS